MALAVLTIKLPLTTRLRNVIVPVALPEMVTFPLIVRFSEAGPYVIGFDPDAFKIKFPLNVPLEALIKSSALFPSYIESKDSNFDLGLHHTCAFQRIRRAVNHSSNCLFPLCLIYQYFLLDTSPNLCTLLVF